MLGFLHPKRWELVEYARDVVRNKKIGVNQACLILGISKDTYYHSRDPDEGLKKRYEYLKPKILEIIKHNPGYGYPRIKRALEEEYKEIVNHKLLLKLLKIWQLSLPRNKKRRKKNWVYRIIEYLGIKSNLLRSLLLKGIEIKCFQVILSDVTELYYSGNKAYLCVHMDYSGKYILGWELGLSADQSLVISSCKKAFMCLKRFGINIFISMIFHQDQGSVYTSEGYVSLILENKISLSYSRKGEPGDNAVNESFFSRLKEEWRDYISEIDDIKSLRSEIKKIIDYYNRKRYHSSIGYKTPLAYILERLKT